MKNLLLTITILLCGIITFAQENSYSVIKGVCLDDRNKALENVGIYSIDSILLAVSDKQGSFTLFSSKEGDSIFATHLAYENVNYVIDKHDFDKQIVIKMNVFSTMLPE